MKNFMRVVAASAICLALVAGPAQAQFSGGTTGASFERGTPVQNPPIRVPLPLPQRPSVPVVVTPVVPFNQYYNPYYNPYYGAYGPYYNPYGWGPSYNNPYGAVVIPTESMYGPAAVRRFLGTDDSGPPQRAANVRSLPADESPKPKVRETNADTKILAGKALDAGDVLFGKQKYSPALDRYKKAVQTAPDLGESYFREGHAFVALGQYVSAGKAFRKGLDIGPDWVESGFRLDQIYGENHVAKSSHFETLALAVEQNPKDANLLFVLGMELYFDGQVDRARKFFTRAVALGGNRDRLLDPLLASGQPAAKKNAPTPERVEF